MRSAEAAEPVPVPVTSLPLLPGGQVKDGLAPGRTDADFRPVAGSDRSSSSFDVQRSSVIRRTQYTQEYRNPDGTVTERRSATPLNMRDATGQWQPIDTSWRPGGDGRLGTARHPLDPTFAADAADPTMVQAGVGADRVSFALEGVAASKRTTDGETVGYLGVRPGVDLRYHLGRGSVKETVVLHQPGESNWRFRLRTAGLTPVVTREGGGVEFRDGADKPVMVMPPVEVWDSAGNGDSAPAMTGGRYVLAKDNQSWLLTVEVDPNWLKAAERKYPVFVDPTLSYVDLHQAAWRTDGYDCEMCGLRIGNSQAKGDTYNRSAFRLDLGTMMGRNVVGARVDVWREPGVTGSTKSWPADLYHTASLDFNGLGAHMASAVIGESGQFSDPELTHFLRHLVSVNSKDVWFTLVGAEKPGTWTYKHLDVQLLVDYGSAPLAANLVSPADRAVLTDTRPTLQVTPVPDKDGEQVRYCFRVATGADANSGIVVESGCIDSPTWTVPDRVLRDGVAYTWHAWTTSNLTTVRPPWVGHFRIDQRIGDDGPAPTDELGGAEVNLANGNVAVAAKSPSLPTVGGEAGVTFSYNSQQATPRGLTAEYFNDVNHNQAIDDGAQPSLVRLEPAVNIDYGTESPQAPALPSDFWIARWSGYFAAPESGTYQFAGVHEDAFNVWVNGQQLYRGGGVSAVNWAPDQAIGSVTLTKGQRIPIKIELAEQQGSAIARLFVRTTDGVTVPPQLANPSWLFTDDLPPLSEGWTLSADLDGGGEGYVSAQQLDQTIVLTDATGAKHSWTKKSTGGYTPPEGEDGILALNADGKITLHDGDVTVFGTDGRVESQTAAVDDRKPAALQYVNDGAPRRLREIRDPVSGRAIRLHYNRPGDTCYTGLTPPPGADSAPPAQALCRLAYWDGRQTVLWYANGNLARIEDPGGEVTDFGYTADGALQRIREPLLNDWVAADFPNRGSLPGIATEIAYVNHDGKNKVSSVTETPPAPGQPRPAHRYRYVSANETQVDAAGMAPASGFDRKVTYDQAYRTLSDVDATGRAVRHEWNARDLPTATIDSAGRKSTTVYDHVDRVTDEYGPAPESCFTGLLPKPECQVTREQTEYDKGGLGSYGLAAAYWANKSLAGAPKVHATGVGDLPARLVKNWADGAPAADIPADYWSARFTGEVLFPTAGSYKIRVLADDGIRLWLDDQLLLDDWIVTPEKWRETTVQIPSAGTAQRLRLDYFDEVSAAKLELHWTKPDGTSEPIPGQQLWPRYGLTTKVTEHDDGGAAPTVTTGTAYAAPHLGLATARTVDPGRGTGMNLQTRTEFETNGYQRRVSSKLPAGNEWKYTSYGDTETRDNPCTPESDPAPQNGLAKLTVAPAPASGAGLTSEAVYDGSGKVVATRVNDQAWTCLFHDARDRLVKQVTPAHGDQPERVVTTVYAVGADPLVTSVSDPTGTITTTVDLLGRVVSYVDKHGATTTTAYDQGGRPVSALTTVNGITSQVVSSYDDADRVTSIRLDGQEVATPAYDAAGELATVGYGNGTALSTITRHGSGELLSLAWGLAADRKVTDTVTRSRGGTVLTNTVAENGTTAASYSYTYDAAGRLVTASVPHHELIYRFDGTGGCGPNTAAGTNGNRTALLDSKNGAAPVTTSYCYDNADRLLSASGGTQLQVGYDSRGNATTVGGDTLTYDGADRHVRTTTAAGATISYTRDATDRLVTRTVSTPGQHSVHHLGYTGGGDTADLVLANGGGLAERILSLPGGVLLAKSYADTTSRWAYPNIHGDVIVTADQAGAKTGGIFSYDPYGQQIAPDSGEFTTIPVQPTGGFDNGWLGQHQRPVENLSGTPAIEMGARTYLPALGRFLQVDPVPGGSANDYDYTNADPVNTFDLDGECAKKKRNKKKSRCKQHPKGEAEHLSGKRQSTKEKHQAGQKAKKMSKGGEKGDKRRGYVKSGKGGGKTQATKGGGRADPSASAESLRKSLNSIVNSLRRLLNALNGLAAFFRVPMAGRVGGARSSGGGMGVDGGRGGGNGRGVYGRPGRSGGGGGRMLIY
ncbi:PA14 domain-containing protein [Amycolatopsis azurea]|uniref:PA14 domain-containing protein n=1 Tax=Amycolatopsis azurea TaxID=36819 RepID=UPI00380C02D9